MKLSVRRILSSAVFLCFAACGSSNISGALGTITVNGPGLSGTVPPDTTRIYTLAGIVQGRTYTLATEIPGILQPDGSITSDGTLTVLVYSSEDAYTSNSSPEPISVAPSERYPYVYEGYFTAAQSGDYVAALSGTSSTSSYFQFFYNLKLMSADPILLTSFATPTFLAVNATLNTGVSTVFNGGAVTQSGIYSLRLSSNSTSTLGYPQLFVYANNTLETESLLYSSVTDSMHFEITSFLTPTDSGITIPLPVDVISGVTLTSMSNGPYIVVTGIGNPVAYTLSIGP